MDLESLTPIDVDSVDFTFGNLAVDFYIGMESDFAALPLGSSIYDLIATTQNDSLWLSMIGIDDPEIGNAELEGSGDHIGTGSDTGEGSGLLAVVGGIAMNNFDTNSMTDGADMVLTSHFAPESGLLAGGFTLIGNSIPEPTSIALLGLGLLGFASSRKRKA